MRQAEQVKVWRVPRLGGLELLRARHLRQSFPRHTHQHYAIGVIEQGALGFFYRGQNVVASSGEISLCIPGEVHTGQPAVAEGWGYRMFYFDSGYLQNLVSEMAERPRDLPFFSSGVIDDPALARQIRRLHQRLENPAVPALEQESSLISVLAKLIQHHADTPLSTPRPSREPQAIAGVKGYLEEHPAEGVSLGDLCQLTGLSRFHLVRTFTHHVGIPPHAYLRQVRLERAKALLASGHPIAETAIATGFADQSHLNRWLKRLWGFTPAQYRNSVQDA